MNIEIEKKFKKIGILVHGLNPSPNMTLICERPIAIAGEVAMRGKIGAYSYIRKGRLGPGVKSFGRYCSIAPSVTAGDGNHPMDWLSTHPFQYGLSSTFRAVSKKLDFDFLKPEMKPKSVEVGNDVWIGTNVTILPGVKIADGAIIAAGSVVTKNVPPYAIIAGIPGKIIRYRFEQGVIDKLLELKWWRFDADSLLGVNFDIVDRAIDQIETMERQGSLKEIDKKTIKLIGSDLK